MPSEDRVRLALDGLAGPIGAYRSALLQTADEMRGDLAMRQTSWEGLVARVAAELGPLGVGRIDPERFASVVDTRQVADPTAARLIERALAVLLDLAGRTEELCRLEVPAGGSLYQTVSRALAEVGRAFAAARVVVAGRAGRRRPDVDAGGIEPLPFPCWTRKERRIGPPLVAVVQGSDVRAAALSEFLDGRQRIALVIEGECPPAPLARLIGPGTFVLQTSDGTGLDRLAAWEGAGIAALVPESAARFVHDPAAGSAPWERITVGALPEQPPRRALGGLSAAQQTEELALLRSLAARPAGARAAVAAGAVAAGAVVAAEPADRLATWLLSQVDLSDLG